MYGKRKGPRRARRGPPGAAVAKRQELAKELGYTGDMNDSAKMNVWLHAKVMENLAQQGGQVAGNLLNPPAH